MSYRHNFPQTDIHSEHDLRLLVEIDHGEGSGEEHMKLPIPASTLWYPIFDEFDGNRTVVALLGLAMRWDSVFLSSMPTNANGIMCVVSNPCGQVFTYKLEGPSAYFLGFEDLHDSQYDGYVVSTETNSSGTSFTGIPLNEEYCRWRLDVYPSYQMKISFYDSEPAIYAGAVAAIFIFTALLLILYDWLVERRQKYLQDTANKTNAIISSLFPDMVRDRLFEENQKKVMSSKQGVKKFMNDSSGQDDQTDGIKSGSAPIADLFPDCTVMFGDIAGFTAWSSAREPSQVFTLLETIYGAFDKTAKKHGVFKVETIGDCYLAVTGLPEPQSDHAVRSTCEVAAAALFENIIDSLLTL
jgi:hypothetical protein